MRGTQQTLADLASLPVAPAADAKPAEVAQYQQALQDLKKDQRQAAEALVEFERLKCHLEENFDYYLNAIWQQATEATVQKLLTSHHVPRSLVEPTIVGFVGGRLAFRVHHRALKKDFNFEQQLKKSGVAKVLARPPLKETLELPTPGLTVEPSLGECDACEPFIEDHRNLDLVARQAEVDRLIAEKQQAEAETARLEARVVAGELGDPTPYRKAEHLEVTVTDKP
jgi:hypothetical protein